MKPLQIATLAAMVVNVLITLLVLRGSFRTRTAAAYAIWGASLTLWNLGAYFAFGGVPHEEARFWLQVLQLGVIFLPVSLLHLCLGVASIERPRLIAFLYVLHCGFALSLSGIWFMQDVRLFPFGYWAVPGPLFWAYLGVYLGENVGVFCVLYSALQKARGVRATQLRLMLVAFVLLCLFGTHDLLPILGYAKYPNTGTGFIPLSNLAAIFYGLLVAYSLLQHQFLDVHVRLSRAAAQTVRLFFVSLVGLILLLGTTTLFPGHFTTFGLLAALAIVLASATTASIVFPRLFGKGDDNVERRILGDRFEYQDRVRGFIENMAWYSDMETMLNDLHELLTGTFRIDSYRIILRDETNRLFTVFRAYPDEPPRQLPELKVQSPVFQYFEWSKAEYLSLNAKYSRPGERSIEKQSREQLAGFDAEFAFPLTSQNEPFGIFLVGPKTSGDPFTATDITLLVTMVKNLSLMVNQIRLKSQILHTQELDLLGRMSRGMAHDLNNLLTPVWTLLQLSQESGTGECDEELLPVAIRNIKTMRAYIREALFFSEHLRPEIGLCRLDLVILHAVELARASRSKFVEIAADSLNEALVEMDEVLVQRLIANLISNAIDASVEGSIVRIHLERLVKTEASRDWFRLRIVDQGEGIAKENLERVLTPYFTTKNRGDETRGFGLGLAICRKIVNLHGGNLSISSQLGRGTTVQIDLPSQQVQQPMTVVSDAA